MITPRIEKIRQNYVSAKPQISCQRAAIWTESFQTTEGQPACIRAARAFYDCCDRLGVHIFEGELVVGAVGEFRKCGILTPEFSWMWVDREMDQFATRPQDPYVMTEEQRQFVRETIFPYWMGKSLEEAFLARILMKRGTVLAPRELCFSGSSPLYDDRGLKPQWEDPSWYLSLAEDYCLGFLKRETQAYGKPRLFAQAQAAYAVRHMFDLNTDSRDRQVLKGEAWKRFLDACKACMVQVEKGLLLPEESLHVERRMQYSIWPLMMKLACREREKKSIVPMAMVELVEEEAGEIRLEGSFDQIGAGEKGSLTVKYRGSRIPHSRSPRYARLCFFGKPLVKKYAFAVSLTPEMLRQGGELSFWLGDGKKEQRMKTGALRYTAGFTHLLEHSGRNLGPYRLSFRRDGGEGAGVSVRKAGRGKRIREEAAFLKEILTSPYGSRKLFLVRALYWLTRPWYRKKHIWLTFDKLYKGGDCGEYFYKYMEKQKKQGC